MPLPRSHSTMRGGMPLCDPEHVIDDRAELACDVAETTVALRSDSITNY